MVSWSNGKLEKPSNRSNNAKTLALKQDFLASLDWAQPVYKTLQQLQELGQVSGQLLSFLQQRLDLIYKLNLPAELEGVMCFWVSRSLNIQHDAGWHHQRFHLLLPCSCAAPPLQLLSDPVVCHQALRWVTLPEDSLEPAGRVCCLQPAGGMQHNLLDLSEWPQGNLHMPAPCILNMALTSTPSGAPWQSVTGWHQKVKAGVALGRWLWTFPLPLQKKVISQ